MASANLGSTQLALPARVDALREVRRVYHSHQLNNPVPFEDAVPRAVVEEQVRTSLKETSALAKYWSITITDDRLAREVRRILRDTKDPAKLAEIRAALGYDPVLFAETVARPLLVRTLARNLFRYDPRIHAQSRERAVRLERALRAWEIDPSKEQDGRVLREFGRVERPALFSRWRSVPPGTVGPVEETGAAFVVPVLLSANDDAVRLAVFVVAKRTWDAWWRDVAPTLAPDERILAGASSIRSASESPRSETPAGGPDCSPNDSWAHGMLQGVSERASHSAVWTGTEMLVWGGGVDDPDAYMSVEVGARYDPATDTWTQMSTIGAPSPRMLHSAVWTGREMLIWGSGPPDFGGGRYDPVLDRWSPISKSDAPSPRIWQVAVWTGREMLVWGGSGFSTGEDLNSGGRYDPERDRWTPMTTANAPPGRIQATALWTGREMLVWGGQAGGVDDVPFGTGGRYDPILDQWLPIALTGAPSPRWGHSAVWAGTEMIVWGGSNRSQLATTFNDGARYSPATDSWIPVSLMGAPSPRAGHSAQWSGEYVLVWGGQTGELEDRFGGRFRPSDDTWLPMSATSQPGMPPFHRSVWTGTEMIVWGGGDNVFPTSNHGGRYDPVLDEWRLTSLGPGPEPVIKHRAVWTGNEMITWGGWGGDTLKNFPREGGRFDPALDAWIPMTTTGAPDGRELHTMVWTGSRMIVWGGLNLVFDMENVLSDGARYDPLTDTWSAVSNTGVPAARRNHTAVWTGSQMLVWGGIDSANQTRNDGSRYDPATDQWQTLSITNAPASRHLHTASWTGSVMVVWGGLGAVGGELRTGGRYNPTSDTWAATTTTGAPTARYFHSSVWTGSRVVIWGGIDAIGLGLNTGSRYDPVANSWAATATSGAPGPRQSHTGLWTGSEMLVWGGELTLNSTGVEYFSGGRYNPATNSWTPTATKNAPAPRADHVAVWTGQWMMVWSGESQQLSTGGTYVVGPPDADADGVADSCDCASNDGSASAVPNEAATLRFASDKTALTWYAASGGSGTIHDVVRGTLATFPVGAGGESCLASGLTEVRLDEPTVPASGGFWYLVRGRNTCGSGTYGQATGGTRTTATCP